MTDSARLEARGINVSFQGLRALSAIDLELAQGEILGLIGPNGAGKTTLVNVLSGFQRPDTGDVLLNGARITGFSPTRRARAGLVRTFQNVRLFGNMTVEENVEAAVLSMGHRAKTARERTAGLLTRFGLSHRAGQLARSLPYGDSRRLGFARALASEPRYLLLDEPAAGLDHQESDEMSALLTTLPERDGCGVLLIEHDMRVVMRICHRIHVIDHGSTISIGSPEAVRADPAVLEAYLGTGHR